MRRLLFTIAASAALLALGPAVALAKPHPRHHARHHARHKAKVRHERFGNKPTTAKPTTTPPTTTQPTNPPAEPSAGTVVSFTDGVLTIKLNDGSMVSGKVTDATELKCEAADNEGTVQDESGSDRGPGGGPGNSGSGDSNSAGNDGRGDQGDHGDQGGNDNEHNPACTTAALTQGAVVHNAELEISSHGATWEEVELQS